MTSNTSSHGAANLSRRSFFKLTVGSITLLPTVASVNALAPLEALADEEEPHASLASGSTIYVVSPKELGLVVRDVSVEDGSANLIQGAHVKIISRFNGMVLEDDTDDGGAVHFDISDLAEDDGKEAVLARYAFNATVEVTAPGYRDFRAARIRVEGGTTLGIPTQPRVSGLPYPVCVSFDEWDVLYSEGDDSTFVSSTGNDASHTIDLTINDCPAGSSVTAGLYVDGRHVSSTSVQASSDGSAKVALSDNFLLSSSGNALPTGDDHSYTMRYEMGGTTYEVPIKLTVVEAAPEAQASTLKKDLELSPFNDVTMFVGLTVPKNWALIGGTKIKLWKPSFFFDCAYDPFGFIMIKLTPPAMGYFYDNGKPDEEGWQVQSRKWPQEQFKKTINSMANSVGKTFDAPKGTEENPEDIKTFNQIDFAQKFSFTVQPEIMAAATWEFGDKESRGRAQIALRIGANYSFSESFWAGPIPFIIRFGVGLNVVATAQMGYVSPSVWSFSQYRWDYSSTGFDLQICFAPTLAVGVGIGGVASIALRGNFSLTFSLHTGPLPAGYYNLPDPHLRFAGKAAAMVEAEVLWFTNSWKLWESDWPDWYNNWEGKLGADDGRGFVSEIEDKTLADTFNEASIITTGALDSLAEFETGGLAGMAQEERLMGYTLFERGADGNTPVAQLYLSESEVTTLTSEPIVGLEAADGATEGVVAQDAAPVPVDAVDEVAEVEGLVAQDEEEMIAGVIAASAEVADVPSDETVAVEGQELTAQADEAQPTYILRPSNDEIVAFEVGEVDAVPVGDHGYAEIPEEPAGVLQLGLEQGFRPTTDIRLAENILLPSHTKIFTVGSNDYIARIGVARVAGQARTRVICQQVGGKDRRVLDFASSYRNDDCYDYDFDIATTRMGGVDIVSMVVISGTRPQGDATSFAQAATETFFSFVSCDNWDGDRVFTGVTIIGAAVDTIGDRGTTYPYRSYSCPRLVQIKDTKDGVEYGQAAVAYLERVSIFPDQIMGTDPDLTRAGVGLLFFANGDRTIDVTSLDLMRGLNSRILDPTITDIALSGRADGYQLLELKGTEKTHYVLCETDPCWYIIGGHPLPHLESVREVDLGAYDQKISRLISMESGSYFLGCIDGLLKRIDVNRGDAPSFSYSDFGGDELNMNDFGVLENGNVLYWAASRENGGYTFDGATNDAPTLREDDGGRLTQIVGARVRGGKLSKSFALCEVNHPISGIRTFGNSDDHMSFVSSNIVDLATGKGEQWYTAVPWVRCANLLEAYPYDTLVAKGDHLPFYVTLRNDGNCYLSGVELAVAEIGGDEIGRIRLDFAEDNLLPSEWNPRAEDGSLENVEDDYALAPGTTSRYYASFVTIPESWEGEKHIEVYVTAVYGSTVSLAGGLAAQADESIIDYIPEQRIPAMLNLGNSERTLDEAGIFSRADITIIGSNGGPAPSDGGTPSGGGNGNTPSGGSKSNGSSRTSSSTSSKKGLPRTGDSTSTTTAALLALGGAASIAAASALRHEDDETE